MPRDTRSRAARLIDRALTSGIVTPDELCRAVRVTPTRLDAYRRGDEVMPFDRQIALAAYLADRAPALRRDATALRAQAVAAMRFLSGDTHTHTSPWVAPW